MTVDASKTHCAFETDGPEAPVAAGAAMIPTRVVQMSAEVPCRRTMLQMGFGTTTIASYILFEMAVEGPW